MSGRLARTSHVAPRAPAARFARVAAVAALLAVVAACSSSKFTSSTPVDGGANVDADATAQCIVPPAGVADEATFCSVLAAARSNCGNCEVCHQVEANACVTTAKLYSTSFKKALDACRDRLACTQFFPDQLAPDGEACVRERWGPVEPTPAQIDVKGAYCALCPTYGYECAHFFDGALDSALGWGVLRSSDAMATRIQARCLPSGADAANPVCDPAVFRVCELAVLCDAVGPSPCGRNVCNK